jgi:hypothetical protein
MQGPVRPTAPSRFATHLNGPFVARARPATA